MKFTVLNTAVASACLILAGCGGGSSSDDVASNTQETQAVSIKFAAYAGNNPVSCATEVTGLGTGATTAKVKDFRFYVSNVSLIASDGSAVPLTLPADDDWNLTAGDDRLTLIDLEDASESCEQGTAAMNTEVTGTVPRGDYVGLRATMGVPAVLNHSDYATASAPLDIQSMAWSWQSGRKFAKIELTDPAGAEGSWSANTFNFHLGSTGCEGNPASGEVVSCSAPNRMALELTGFDPATQQLAVDIGALFGNNDITVNESGAPGCMSAGTDPECQQVFDALAIDWKADGSGTGMPIDAGLGQRLFRAIAR